MKNGNTIILLGSKSNLERNTIILLGSKSNLEHNTILFN
jgi:hypothetical protein